MRTRETPAGTTERIEAVTDRDGVLLANDEATKVHDRRSGLDHCRCVLRVKRFYDCREQVSHPIHCCIVNLSTGTRSRMSDHKTLVCFHVEQQFALLPTSRRSCALLKHWEALWAYASASQVVTRPCVILDTTQRVQIVGNVAL